MCWGCGKMYPTLSSMFSKSWFTSSVPWSLRMRSTLGPWKAYSCLHDAVKSMSWKTQAGFVFCGREEGYGDNLVIMLNTKAGYHKIAFPIQADIIPYPASRWRVCKLEDELAKWRTTDPCSSKQTGQSGSFGLWPSLSYCSHTSWARIGPGVVLPSASLAHSRNSFISSSSLKGSGSFLVNLLRTELAKNAWWAGRADMMQCAHFASRFRSQQCAPLLHARCYT